MIFSWCPFYPHHIQQSCLFHPSYSMYRSQCQIWSSSSYASVLILFGASINVDSFKNTHLYLTLLVSSLAHRIRAFLWWLPWKISLYHQKIPTPTPVARGICVISIAIIRAFAGNCATNLRHVRFERSFEDTHSQEARRRTVVKLKGSNLWTTSDILTSPIGSTFKFSPAYCMILWHAFFFEDESRPTAIRMLRAWCP